MKQAIVRSALVTAMAVSAPLAVADQVDWTTWNAATTTTGQTGGSITGTTAGGVTVGYAGEVESLQANYPSWTPTGTFSGGDVGNPPPVSGGIIQLFGGNTNVDTITFSQAVTNPVLAIWSLGQGSINAQFDFINATPTFESGGPSAEYNGSAITVSGNNVYGSEGNGTVEFKGTFTQLSWTNPVYEDWYGVTVGVSAVPEPSTYAFFFAGLALMGWLIRRNSLRTGSGLFQTAA